MSLLSSEQATAYLLCGECEERFNSGGETWVLKNCWHSEVDFPLRSNVIAIAPSPLSTPGFTIFESVCSEAIDAVKLTYFGVSIFWRASVHDWVLMRQQPKRLELSPYEEPLRLFLLEQAGFPSDALMIISVTSAMDRMRNMLMTFPFLKSRQPEFRQYRFTIPGITFQLFVGKNTPYALRRLSIQSPERAHPNDARRRRPQYAGRGDANLKDSKGVRSRPARPIKEKTPVKLLASSGETASSDMATATIVFGLCGSGKTWLAKQISASTGAVRFDGPYGNSLWPAIAASLQRGRDCVVEEICCCQEEFRRDALGRLSGLPEVRVEWRYFENDLESANWNIDNAEDRPDKDPAEHKRANVATSRRYTYPASGQPIPITRIARRRHQVGGGGGNRELPTQQSREGSLRDLSACLHEIRFPFRREPLSQPDE